MNAGKLRQRVTIQRPAYQRQENGERTEVLQDVATVWARARRLRASERQELDQAVSDADWRVTIRHGADIKDTDVIAYNGRRLDIVGITDVDEEYTWLEVDCKEHREPRP